MKYLLALILSFTFMASVWAEEPKPQPDKLKDALAELITGVTQTAGQAKDFLVSEVPDVVKQLLVWKAAESALFTSASLAALIAFSMLNRRNLKDNIWLNDPKRKNTYEYLPSGGWLR